MNSLSPVADGLEAFKHCALALANWDTEGTFVTRLPSTAVVSSHYNYPPNVEGIFHVIGSARGESPSRWRWRR